MNIYGEHTATGIFAGLAPIVVPWPPDGAGALHRAPAVLHLRHPDLGLHQPRQPPTRSTEKKIARLSDRPIIVHRAQIAATMTNEESLDPGSNHCAVCLALPALAQEPAGGRRRALGRPVGRDRRRLPARHRLPPQGRSDRAGPRRPPRTGISRNPGAAGAIRTMTIIGLALIESLVLYALLIAVLIRRL